MRRFAPILLLAGSLAAVAEDGMPNLELRKAECPNIAKAAGYAYYAKKEEGRILAVSEANRATGLAPLYQWSIDYATNTATGPDDAVHQAIEKCLRNVEMVKAASERGQVFSMEK
ncbi:MAG: hypothetical protein H7234_05680 [Herminiimonas sp.]|nr:hypothetical protein [Herminiimonas sp.]